MEWYEIAVIVGVALLILVIAAYNTRFYIKKKRSSVKQAPKVEKTIEPRQTGVKINISDENYLKDTVDEALPKVIEEKSEEPIIIQIDEDKYLLPGEEDEFYGNDLLEDETEDNDLEGNYQESEKLEVFKHESKEAEDVPHPQYDIKSALILAEILKRR